MQNIGRYQIKSEIARGGMAIVFHAFDPSFERDVAIKLLPRQFLYSDPATRARFQREVKTIAALEHSGIVPVYDVGIHDEQPYLVMRLMTGGSLADRIKLGNLPVQEALTICERIGSALDEAHSQGIVHRDLKPNNILFDHRGDAFLSDFGIAKLNETGASLTDTSILVGTPAYMSPEQAMGEANIDGRSDVYSLGVILFESLSGELPFRAETPMGIAMKHVMEPVPALPAFDEPFQQFFQRVLAKEPNSRFESAAEMCNALAGAERGESLPLLPATNGQELTKPSAILDAGSGRGWQRWAMWGGLAGVLLIAGILWGQIRALSAESESPTEMIAEIQTPTPESLPSATPIPTSSVAPTPSPQPSSETTSETLKPSSLTPTPTNLAPTSTPTSTPTFTRQPPTPTANPFPATLCPTFPEVKVRREPSIIARVLALLVEGQCVDVVARTDDGDWYNVQLAGGQLGWVAEDVGEVTRNRGVLEIPVALTVPPTPLLTATPTRFVPSSVPVSRTPTAPTLTPTPKPATVTPSPTPSALVTWIAGISPPIGQPLNVPIQLTTDVGYSIQQRHNRSESYRFFTSIWVVGHDQPNCEGNPLVNYTTVDRADVEMNGRRQIEIEPDFATDQLQSISVTIHVAIDNSPVPQAGSPNYLSGCYPLMPNSLGEGS